MREPQYFFSMDLVTSRVPIGFDLKPATIILRQVLQAQNLVKPQALERLDKEDPNWKLWPQDLSDDVNLTRFENALFDKWCEDVMHGHFPTEKQTLGYFSKVRGGAKQKPKKLSDNPLVVPSPALDAGPAKSVKLDDASWHLEGDFPDDLESESAYTHIGFFIAWACFKGFYSSGFLSDAPDLISQLLSKHITPGEFAAAIDGQLSTDMLCSNAAQFALNYYEINKTYYEHLGHCSVNLPSVYHIQDNWKNYKKVEAFIENSFCAWSQK